jgi:hypothetical protein
MPVGHHPGALELKVVDTTPGETPDQKPHGTIIEFMPDFSIMEKAQ